MALLGSEKHFPRYDGPLAIVACCKLCKHVDTVRKVRSPGRGWGMREGNKQRGRMIQHVKTAHPEDYKSAMTEKRGARASLEETRKRPRLPGPPG